MPRRPSAGRDHRCVKLEGGCDDEGVDRIRGGHSCPRQQTASALRDLSGEISYKDRVPIQ